MTIQEFKQRTNINIEPDEFKDIERMYNASRMDMDEFCTSIKENTLEFIIDAMVKRIEEVESKITRIQNILS